MGEGDYCSARRSRSLMALTLRLPPRSDISLVDRLAICLPCAPIGLATKGGKRDVKNLFYLQ